MLGRFVSSGRDPRRAALRPNLLPEDAPVAAVPGPDPDRVLLVGSGPVAGLGVLSHQQALTGSLARQLVEHSRRGAVVEAMGRIDLRLADVPPLLADARLQRFDAVVLTAGMIEAAALRSRRRWTQDLEAALEALHVRRSGVATVVVTGIPAPTSTGGIEGWRGRVLDEHAAMLNRISEATIASRSHGRYTELAPFPHRDGQPTPACYTRWAGQICEVLEPLLTRTAREIGSDQP